jgi:hypothetical protein
LATPHTLRALDGTLTTLDLLAELNAWDRKYRDAAAQSSSSNKINAVSFESDFIHNNPT